MAELKIELITIGDEILLGHTLDTNAHWIASRLTENGHRLRWISVVGDNASDLRHQLRRAWNRADIVLLTGGLGPTHDDITRPIIADFFDDNLIPNPELAERIRSRFVGRGLKPPPGCHLLAEFPSRATPMPNEHGSAPGIHYSLDDHELFAMPGVPVEMKGMLSDYVLPHLATIRSGVFGYRILRTAGIGETRLAELIGDRERLSPATLAYLPSVDHGVTLRISCTGADTGEIDQALQKAEDYIRSRVDSHIYAAGDEPFEKAILDMLEERNMKLALAESCTGGMIASRIVSVPGSSNSFERGFVTYSNRAKTELLGVDENLLQKHGAVSAEVAAAMAEGARLKAGVDIAVSVTGIAGPTGGTTEKPVGLVFTGVSDGDGCEVQRYHFIGDRDANRRRSAQAALVMLWRRLKDVLPQTGVKV